MALVTSQAYDRLTNPSLKASSVQKPPTRDPNIPALPWLNPLVEHGECMKATLLLAAFLIGAKTASIVQQVNHQKYIETLSREAPETLLPPVRDQFIYEEDYRAALVRYALDGEWATE